LSRHVTTDRLELAWRRTPRENTPTYCAFDCLLFLKNKVKLCVFELKMLYREQKWAGRQ